MKVTENTNIKELILKHPETAEVFMRAGMGCIGCVMASYETIGEGARAHGFTQDKISLLIEKLNFVISKKK